MKTFDQPLDQATDSEVRLSQLPGFGSATPELTLRQKFMVVLVAVLGSFAVGSIPVVYAFTLAPTHSQSTAQTPIPRGEMF